MKKKSLVVMVLAASMLTACGLSNTVKQQMDTFAEEQMTDAEVGTNTGEVAVSDVVEVAVSDVVEVAGEAPVEASVEEEVGEQSGSITIEPVAETERIYESPAKRPAVFKDAEDVEFDEWYDFDTSKVFTFEIEESSKVTFTCENWPDVALYDYAGENEIRIKSGAASDTIVADTYYLKAGRYYVKAKAKAQHSICIECEKSNESFIESYNMSDNSPAEANVINIGKTYYGQIGVDDAIDLYMFTLPADAEVTIFYKSSLANAKYGLADSGFDTVPENLDADAEALAERIGRNVLEEDILKALFSEPRFISDGCDSLTQKIQLKKGVYYFSAAGCALGGEALMYHSGTYEFRISIE